MGAAIENTLGVKYKNLQYVERGWENIGENWRAHDRKTPSVETRLIRSVGGEKGM